MLAQTSLNKTVKFKSTKSKDAFAKDLRIAIARYFKENGISRFGNREMHIKTVIAAVSWLGFFTLIMSDVLSFNIPLLMLAFTLWGFTNIFIALNIAHDACHDAYSANPKINRIMSYSMNLIGGKRLLIQNHA